MRYNASARSRPCECTSPRLVVSVSRCSPKPLPRPVPRYPRSRRCQEVASDESVWKAVTVRAFPWVPADLEPASWRDVYRFHHAAFSLVRGRRSSGGHVPARGMGDVFTLGTQGHVALGG